MDVSVIIVTYNSAAGIAACLASVRAQEGVAFEIIVVDNASADDTVAIARATGAGVRVIENRENVGYGRANNQGFAASRGQFLYLLNPDAQVTQVDALARLCRAMEGHPRWGLAGTRLLTAQGRPESPPPTSYPDQRHVHRDFSVLPGQIAWILGASMFFRREVYEALGGFDPGFFLYSEDTDLCLRLRESGYEIGFLEDVVVRHTGGASEEGLDPYEVWWRRMQGMHRFWKRHYPPADVARLVKRDRRRARFRMLWNGGLAWLRPPGSNHWQKHRRYRAIWEASAQFQATE